MTTRELDNFHLSKSPFQHRMDTDADAYPEFKRSVVYFYTQDQEWCVTVIISAERKKFNKYPVFAVF